MPSGFSSKIKLSLSGFFNRRVLLAFVLCSVGVLPATLAQAAPLVVITTADSGAGSLRQAISDSPAGGSVEFNIPTSDAGYNASTNQFTITLTTGELLIGSDLTINGPATAKIVVSVGSSNFGRVFDIATGNVGISNLTVENGYLVGGPGANGDGGGILNNGTLTLSNCTIYNNVTYGGANTIGDYGGDGRGGGIFNAGTLSLINCTLNSNFANGGGGNVGGDGVGGGIANEGTLTFRSCTLIGNRASSAYDSGGPEGGSAFGGALFQGAAGSTSTQNSIFAGNLSDPYFVYDAGCNCYDGYEGAKDIFGAVTSGGFNLVGRRDGNSGWLGSDLLGGNSDDTALDPQLGPLQDNGGPTLTMKPISGSYAIDQGNRGTDGNGQPINFDQRGDARPLDQPGIANAAGGDGSDIGAVEVGVPQGGSIITVSTTSATGASICATDDCTLQAALNYTNTATGNNTINFRDGLAGSITTQTTFFGLYIGHSVTIQGPGARVLTLTGGGVSRIFNTNVTATDVRISGLTLTDAQNPGSSAPSRYGGAIYNTGGLTLTDCTISNNTAIYNGDGAGVYNVSGATLALLRCTLVGNYAQEFGGGVYSDGAFAATDCTFSANSAFRGGGIISRFNNGASSSVLRNCTITGCLAFNNDGGQGGGGYYAEGGAAQVHVGNSIIAGNSSLTINPDGRGNFTSDGHNFIGNGGASAGFTNGVNGDQVGTTAMPKNPLLANTLANNGGPTDTRALLLGSTAIDAGDDSIAPPIDQRGYTRAGISDVGAFEFGGTLPAPTPINLSGTITYCTNPALPPVPDVTLTLTGTSSDSTLSDGSGNYTFSSLVSGGNYTVTPTKTALAPASAGINTLDVIAIQRHYLSLGTPLTGCKLTAADVNGVGGINTLDVIAVQRFFLGQVTGTANVGKYQFSPVNLTYTGIVSDQTGQNYDALVFGDVAGSTYVHRPEGPSQTMAGDDMSASEVPSTVAAVALPEIAIDQARSNVIVAVTTTEIDAKNKLVGFQGDLTFDERVVTFQSEPVQKAGMTGGNWNVSGNVLAGAGPIRTLRISAYSSDFTPLSGSGTLFELRMLIVSAAWNLEFRTPHSAFPTPLIWAAPPDDFIFIDADLNTQKPGNAAPGSVTPSGKRK